MLELWVPEGNQIKVNKWYTPVKNIIKVWSSVVAPAGAIKSQPKGSKSYKGQLQYLVARCHVSVRHYWNICDCKNCIALGVQ